MSNQIITGSLASVARQTNRPISEAFLDATHLVLLDTSGSMDSADSRGGQRRIAVARSELSKLQAEFPGKIALVCFSSHAQEMHGGVPPEPMGSTDLAGALTHCQKYDGLGLHVVVVSDGQPDSAERALDVAKGYQSKISCVFVGPETDDAARLFLKRLALMSGGQYATADRVRELATALRPLLLAAGSTR